MKTIIAFLLSVTLLSACSSDSLNNESPITDKASTELLSPPSIEKESSEPVDLAGNIRDLKVDGTFRLVNNAQNKTPEMVIRNAHINMRVDDYSKTRKELEKLILSQGAYISNENEQRSEYSRSNEITIRVSNQQFAQLSSDIALLGAEVHSRNMTAEDVGKTYVDIASRLKTKKEVEARYIELLKRSGTIKDILEIENEIRVIREEIEAKEGELKYLADQTAWSTITISFYQTLGNGVVSTEGPGFFSKLADSFGIGWSGFQSFILGFVSAWPVWLILGGFIWLLVRGLKKLGRHFRKERPLQTPSAHS